MSEFLCLSSPHLVSESLHTGLVEEDISVSQMSEHRLQTRDKSQDSPGITVSSSNDVYDVKDMQCDYKRGGWCKVHRKQGTKVLKVTRKWELLKNGLHGYRTHKKVTY